MESKTYWTVSILVVIVLILIAWTLTGNPVQTVTWNSPSTATLSPSAVTVFFAGTAEGSFVMQARPVGSLVRLTNLSSQDIEVRNDQLNGQTNTVTMGSSPNGILQSQYATVCINQNGLSQGQAQGGSWLCGQPSPVAP